MKETKSSANLPRIGIAECAGAFKKLLKYEGALTDISPALKEFYGGSSRNGFSLFRRDHHYARPEPVFNVAYLTNMLHWAMVSSARETGELLDRKHLPQIAVTLPLHFKNFAKNPCTPEASRNIADAYFEVMDHLLEAPRLHIKSPDKSTTYEIENVPTRNEGTLGTQIFAVWCISHGFQDSRRMPEYIQSSLRDNAGNAGQGVADALTGARDSLFRALIRLGAGAATNANEMAGPYLSAKTEMTLRNAIRMHSRNLEMVTLYDEIAAPQKEHLLREVSLKILGNFQHSPGEFYEPTQAIRQLQSTKEAALILAALSVRLENSGLMEFSDRLMKTPSDAALLESSIQAAQTLSAQQESGINRAITLLSGLQKTLEDIRPDAEINRGHDTEQRPVQGR